MADANPTVLDKRTKDLRGRRFGGLVVLSFSHIARSKQAAWLCRCDCGKETTVLGANLRRGDTRSCGCGRGTNRGSRVFKHGLSRTLAFSSWRSAMQRCSRPSDVAYHNYGGRGIRVCERWHDFTAFLADMGERPSAKHSLDRIDNDKGYEPGNCRWATTTEQANNRRTNRLITIDGVTRTVSDWTEKVGLPRGVVKDRLRHGWTEREAVLCPMRQRSGVKRLACISAPSPSPALPQIQASVPDSTPAPSA